MNTAKRKVSFTLNIWRKVQVKIQRKKKENSVLHTKKTGIHRIEINDAKIDDDFDIKFISDFFPY